MARVDRRVHQAVGTLLDILELRDAIAVLVAIRDIGPDVVDEGEARVGDGGTGFIDGRGDEGAGGDGFRDG